MAMNWEKLTVKSQEALQAAAQMAAENGNPEVTPTHLLAAMLEDREGLVLPVLEKIHAPVQQLLAGANSALAKLPKIQGAQQTPGAGAALSRILDGADKEAKHFKDEFVSTEHLLLALTAASAEQVGTALAAAGVTHDAVLKALAELRGSQRVTDQTPEGKFQALEKYAKDLTAQARAAGKSTPSSAATRKSAASSRSSAAAPKTTPSSSASPASARPPSSKASPSRIVSGDVPESLKRQARDRARHGQH